MSVLLFVIISQINLPHYETPEALFAVFSLFLLLCWAEIPFVYLLSLPFQSIYTAYTSLFIITSMITFLFLSVLYLIDVVLDGHEDTARVLHYIFLLNPSYGLASGLSDMYLNYVLSETCRQSSLSVSACKQKDIYFYQSPFELERPGIGITLIYLAIEGVIFMALTLLFDHKSYILQLWRRSRNLKISEQHELAKVSNAKLKKATMDARPKSAAYGLQRTQSEFPRSATHLLTSSVAGSKLKRSLSKTVEDETVKDEKKTIDNMLQNDKIDPDCSIVLSRVSKDYESGIWKKLKKAWKMNDECIPAVSDVNLIVREKECFGLAGFNGSGKSTIFKILTGDIQCTTGFVTICGQNIRSVFQDYVK